MANLLQPLTRRLTDRLAQGVSHARTKGVGGTGIQLARETLLESASIGDLVGTLSVTGLPDGVTVTGYTITADPDSKFALDGNLIELADTIDYDTEGGSFSVTIEAALSEGDPLTRTFSIFVGNVLEVTLNALSIDDDEAVAGEAWSATITGKTSGSTITATSSDGTILTVIGTTVSGTFSAAGSPDITLRETHPDAATVDTVIEITVEAAATDPILVIVTGQSNAENMFNSASSPPAALPGTYYWNGSTLTAVPSANGVRELCNTLKTLTSRDVHIAEAATGAAVSGYFVEGQTGWDEIEAAYTGLGGVDLMVVRHGEGDSAGGTFTSAPVANTKNTFKSNWLSVHTSIETLAGGNVPMIFGSLATYGGDQSVNADAQWWAVQQGIVELCEANARIHYSHSIMDAVRVDSYHYNAASYANAGKRFGVSGAVVLGDAAEHPAWFITAADKATATTTTVTVAHGAGTDFTPTTGITGFEVSDDNSTWISATGVRASATTITLTHSSLGAGSSDNRYTRYQYGTAPDVSGAVLDNSSYAAPLNHSAGQLLVDYALPVMSSSTSPSAAENQTYVMDLTASRPSTFAIGGTDGALFEIQNGDELHFVDAPDYEAPGDSGGNNVYDITITPTATDNSDVGSPQSVAVTVTDVSEGGGPTYAFLVNQVIGGSLHAQTVAADIGSAAADRYILVGVGIQNSDPDPTVTVAGVSLTKLDFQANSDTGVGFYGGLVTTGNGTQNIVVTWTSASYQRKEMAAWKLQGLNSTTHKQLVIGNGNMAVDAGDLVFQIGYVPSGTPGFSGGDQAPDRSAAFDTQGFSADWTIVSTDASFNFGHLATGGGMMKVSFA